MKYLFGPVRSRRLGVSLGVDLVVHKVCSLNCVYCECGATTDLTTQRREYVPVAEVLRELREFLDGEPSLDFITFSGSGEPTLNSGIGEVISFIKDNYRYPVAVLTNGTLLYDEKVRKDLLRADRVVPSLDALDPAIFRKMLRPADGISSEKLVEGLVRFRDEYKGQLYVEIFIIPRLNDTEDERRRMKEALDRIRPDMIQLNMLDRPGTEDWVERAREDSLEQIMADFSPLPVEVVGKTGAIPDDRASAGTESILSTVARRPSTLEDLAHLTGLRRVELGKLLRELEQEGRIEAVRGPRGIYYQPLSP